MRKVIVDNRFKIVIEISLSEKSRKAFLLSLFFLFFVVIKLHADVKKKIK